MDQKRIIEHPVFPGKAGPAARRIEDDADVRAVIELMRLNYDPIVAHPTKAHRSPRPKAPDGRATWNSDPQRNRPRLIAALIGGTTETYSRRR